MDDPRRVGLVEGRRDLSEPVDHLRRLDGRPSRELLEVAPLEQIHHEKGDSAELGGDIGVENPDDVRTPDLGGRAALALETHNPAGRRAGWSVHQLEREQIPRERVLDAIYGSRRAAPQDAPWAVFPSNDLW